MIKPIKFSTVFVILVLSLCGVALIVLGINYFNIEPSGIIESKSDVSFGVTTKLGWILTFAFFVLYLLFSLLRNLYYKITGRN